VTANGDDGYITDSTEEFHQMPHYTASDPISKRYKMLQPQIQSMNRNDVVRVAGQMVKTKPAHFDKRIWSIYQLQMLLPPSFWTLAISTAREN
jgi:hypothetical protein